MKPHGNRKERGAYFTPSPIAALLANWAIRSPSDRVLEPAAGRGALLVPAIARLRSLGSQAPDIYAVELHRDSFERLAIVVRGGNAPTDGLKCGDYFALADELPPVDVVITNPPYVRHHEVPVRAMARMRSAVRLSDAALDGKASSWAYFIVRACEGLKTDGRLAAVLPFELFSTDYGRSLLEFVVRSFTRVSVVRCSDGVFDDLQLRVVLLLADRKAAFDASRDRVFLGDVDSEGTDVELPPTLVESTLETAPNWLVTGSVGTPVVSLVRRCEGMDGISTLSSIADINIGYVSGDARFFHLSETARESEGVTTPHVTRILARGKYADGICFRNRDWASLRDQGRPCWLLTPKDRQPAGVVDLIARGVAKGVNTGTKTSGRTPWWRVPMSDTPDAFLVYMGGRIRLVANEAGVQCPNSLYTVRLLRGTSRSALAAASLTSIFQLSILTNLRDKGGGLTKLEPSDAAKALIPMAAVAAQDIARLDKMVRSGRWKDATALSDEIILRRGLGWSKSLLTEIAAALSTRRAGGAFSNALPGVATA